MPWLTEYTLRQLRPDGRGRRRKFWTAEICYGEYEARRQATAMMKRTGFAVEAVATDGPLTPNITVEFSD